MSVTQFLVRDVNLSFEICLQFLGYSFLELEDCTLRFTWNSYFQVIIIILIIQVSTVDFKESRTI